MELFSPENFKSFKWSGEGISSQTCHESVADDYALLFSDVLKSLPQWYVIGLLSHVLKINGASDFKYAWSNVLRVPMVSFELYLN